MYNMTLHLYKLLFCAVQQWQSAFSHGSATVRGGPGWQIDSLVEVVVQARDAQGSFFISTNTTVQSTQ